MRTYCFKLYNNRKNEILNNAINIAGRIYNHLIALQKRYYRMFGKMISIYTLQKHVTKLKKLDKYKCWNELGSQAIQDITDRIDRAYKLFFRNLKHGIKTAPPSFKKVKKYKSFTLKQAGHKLLSDNRIIIMGKVYKFSKSREVEGNIKTLTVKRDGLGDIYIYIVTDANFNSVKLRSGKSVGFDFGLKTFLTASDGNKIESPLFFRKNSNRLKKLSRYLSFKKKGSNNRKKALLNLIRQHKYIYNCRKDHHFKLARSLAEDYAVICIEDLNLKGMQKLWGKKINDLGFYSFIQILEYQCFKLGSQLIKINRYEPSSKTCFDCGYVKQDLSLKDREWTCPQCGSTHDRDLNAAKNIHKVGVRALTPRVENVSPALAGCSC
jgi:putative transposase